MNLRHYHLILMLLGLTSCKPGNQTADDATAGTFFDRNNTPSNEEVIAAVYDGTYSVPVNFYVDERAQTSESYSLYHVKDQSNSYEICTNDITEAANLEAADNQSRAVNGEYISLYENNLYFEFVRELSYPDDIGNVPGSTSPGFARVFKCASIDRFGVDRNLYTGFGGTLNERPLSAATLQLSTEYLWQFEFFPAGRPKILESTSTELADSHDHSLLLAFAINQGVGNCDRIEVIDWNFSANKQSGEVTRAFRFLFAIEAEIVGGVPELCQ